MSVISHLRPREIANTTITGTIPPAPGPQSLGIFPTQGYRRIVGMVFQDGGGDAVIQVRVRQSMDGVNFDKVNSVPQDTSMIPTIVHTFDILIIGKFVQIDATLISGGPIVTWRAFAQLVSV